MNSTSNNAKRIKLDNNNSNNMSCTNSNDLISLTIIPQSYTMNPPIPIVFTGNKVTNTIKDVEDYCRSVWGGFRSIGLIHNNKRIKTENESAIVKLNEKLINIDGLIDSHGNVCISTAAENKLTTFTISLFYFVCGDPDLDFNFIPQTSPKISIRVCPWENIETIKSELFKWYNIPIEDIELYQTTFFTDSKNSKSGYIAKPIHSQNKTFVLDFYKSNCAPAGTLVLTVKSKQQLHIIKSRPKPEREYTNLTTTSAYNQILIKQNQEFETLGSPFNIPLFTAYDTTTKITTHVMYNLKLINNTSQQTAVIFCNYNLPMGLYNIMNEYLNTKERIKLCRLCKAWNLSTFSSRNWTVKNLVDWLWLKHYNEYDLHRKTLKPEANPIYYHFSNINKTNYLSYNPVQAKLCDYDLNDGDQIKAIINYF